MTHDLREHKEKLLTLVRDIVARDQALREKHQMGDKFKFVREQLQQLQSYVEGELKSIEAEVEKQSAVVAEDEVLVFVYLYNSQGAVFKTWQKMVNPAVFYEYSINRPIYGDKTHVEAFIRSKPNKAQHAFLTIAIKSSELLTLPEASVTKDTNENPLIKIGEGSLRIERLVAFTHNDHEYILNPEGELVRKL